ncbi:MULTISPECIES: P-loop ATPase, Sll1717 family [Paenibacillus]|uniref:FunZ protein n=2 Tax=Paenibacillus TaxID=44249 RepID=A0ABX2Z4K5_PAEPO|nr:MULTISPECIES: hypothetical protein [Paenibacillus]MDR6777036.1 hypothetical protein [Paenibacillus peoriae]ODA06127.1 hypothetical protein A7312_17755 [Paenibacillus polymyxa]OME71728.1 hypothetical protein BK119_08930 [Paenibacillus peoriae]
MSLKSTSLVEKIDFGDIDGLYDKNIDKYFLDEGYWEKLIEEDTYFVIGRKGTGKSAIYNWIRGQQYNKSALISNLSFKEFPFEKLLKLSDENFSKPNQYQSIWRNIILSEIAHLITLDQQNEVDDNYKNIVKYVKYTFGSDLTDLHKQITESTEKTTAGLAYRGTGFGSENSNSTSYSDGLGNITQINRKLEKVIRDYLKASNSSRYVIQFDQLDDNYTAYSNKDEYFQCIISLFKTAYDINQIFRMEDIPAKAILYLRSDIFYWINNVDAESARWDQFKLDLNWSIVNRNDWTNPKLLQLINKRIIASSLESNESENPFNIIFNTEKINLKENGRTQDIFKYIIHRTFHRPRDVVQFCLKIQEQVKNTNELYFRTIKNAEKEYSLWLLSEVKNELSPKISDIDSLYEFLRLLGSSRFSMNEFKLRYKKFESILKYDSEELLKLLYNVGIIYNVNDAREIEIYSIIRNDRSVFNRDLKIQLHPGYYQGLYISKFLKR